jgi:hypothetical protein
MRVQRSGLRPLLRRGDKKGGEKTKGVDEKKALKTIDNKK